MNRKLSEEDVQEVVKLLDEGVSSLIIAKKYKVAPNTISDIKRGKTWTFITGIKPYENVHENFKLEGE